VTSRRAVLIFRVVLALGLGAWAFVRFGCVPGVPRTVYRTLDEEKERGLLERALQPLVRLPDGSVLVRADPTAEGYGPVVRPRAGRSLRVGETLPSPPDHHGWATWTLARVTDTEVEFAVEYEFDERSFGVNSVSVTQGTVRLPCAPLAPGTPSCEALAAMTARALEDLRDCAQAADCVQVEAGACAQAWVNQAQQSAALERVRGFERACPSDAGVCGARPPLAGACHRGRCVPPASSDY
jgi:hypothetical protein